MSNAIKINNKDKKADKPKVSQSIPVHFYAKYIPPDAPRIKPKAAPSNIPDLGQLPGVSQETKGIDIGKTGSYSLKSSKHPMSMPVRQGLMGPKTPFDIKGYKKNDAQDTIDENKEEPNSLFSINQYILQIYSINIYHMTRNFALNWFTSNTQFFVNNTEISMEF